MTKITLNLRWGVIIVSIKLWIFFFIKGEDKDIINKLNYLQIILNKTINKSVLLKIKLIYYAE